MRIVLTAALLCLVAARSGPAQDAPRPGRQVPVRRPPSATGSVPSRLPLRFSGPATTGAITPLDLMTRIYRFADDSMMGRLAGTVWNDKGTDYIAAELRRLGLQPGGDDGTFFQHPLVRREVTSASFVGIGERRLEMWRDWVPRDQGTGARAFDGVPVVFAGTYGDTASYLPPGQAAGKVVLFRLGRTADGRVDHNVNRFVLTARYPAAAAIVVAQLDHLPAGYLEQVYREPQLSVKRDDAGAAPERPSWFYVTTAIAEEVLGARLDSARAGQAGRAFGGRIAYESRQAPGRNVLAVLPGSDPALRGQYVVIGAHNDHVGFSRRPVDHDSIKALMMHAAPQGADSPRPQPTEQQWAAIRASLDSMRRLRPPRPDSIYNGADDDASGSMGLLEIAERFATAKERPRRSIVFAWHVAEELGLWGASYFTDHPTVPRDSIVAQLNIDMIGRGKRGDIAGNTKEGALIEGGAGYVQLIGARRLSTELGDIVERTNARGRLGLRFDYALDANGHPQNIYCRSDHYMYARYGIPIVFFTTGGHADYHQVTDEPQYLDYDRAAQVSKLVHASATAVANLGHRVAVDQPKPDPRGSCRQ